MFGKYCYSNKNRTDCYGCYRQPHLPNWQVLNEIEPALGSVGGPEGNNVGNTNINEDGYNATYALKRLKHDSPIRPVA